MIHHGDLFDVLPTLPAESIDAVVTDPPYGIGFMGREWDTFKPGDIERRIHLHDRKTTKAPDQAHGRGVTSPSASASMVAGKDYDYSAAGMRRFQEWCEAWGREVFRVLKPGGYILSCGAPRAYHRMASGLEDAGFEIRDCLAWLFGSGFPKSLNIGDGLGTALKPAHEPIVLARKPFKGSVKANVAQHGTGALNIDACRIEGLKPVRVPMESDARNNPILHTRSATGGNELTDVGRWPANVCLDDIAAIVLDEQSGELVSGANPTQRGSDKFRDVYGAFKGQEDCEAARGMDVGGASRFYYVAKPSREERDMGCYDLAPRPRDESRKEGHPGGDNPRNRGLQPRGNHHPTVKPIELMRWLVRLVTPPGGTVLDPFTGSGTTGMACVYEQRQFIGIEREAEYIAIAERRIASVAPLFAQAEGR